MPSYKNLSSHHNSNRREFLKLSGRLGLAGMLTPLSMNLFDINQLAAATANEYKALVCVFLLGGNDQNNTLIPHDDANYALFRDIRANLVNLATDGSLSQSAIAAMNIQPSNITLDNNLQLGLNPVMGKMRQLFNTNKMSVIFNVGPLVEPTTKADYLAGAAKLPPQLFSHNDQQSVWQSFRPEGSTNGLGGNINDFFFNDHNAQSPYSNISVYENSVFLVGEQSSQFQISAAGVKAIPGVSDSYFFGINNSTKSLYKELITQPGFNELENEYKKVIDRSINSEQLIMSNLSTAPYNSAIDTIFAEPDLQSNSLASQLKMVARLISIRDQLGQPLKRQIFMVGLGGFDNHDDLLQHHPQQLKKVSDAMEAFYRATEAMNLQNNVTSFTASDFGRTFTMNADGSDHGWGSHHFIVGGAVNGGNFYGEVPSISLANNPVDIGRGRLLPTTSHVSYLATLARWFGLNLTEIESIMPELVWHKGHKAFTSNLGFMQEL